MKYVEWCQPAQTCATDPGQLMSAAGEAGVRGYADRAVTGHCGGQGPGRAVRPAWRTRLCAPPPTRSGAAWATTRPTTRTPDDHASPNGHMSCTVGPSLPLVHGYGE